MPSENETIANGESLGPDNLAPQGSLRGNSPVTEPPRNKLPDNCSAVQAGKKRRHKKSSNKSARKMFKGSGKQRSKSRRYSTSPSPSTSSSCEGSTSTESDSEGHAPASKGNESSLLSRTFATENGDGVVSEEIIEFAAAASFEGLSKSARKMMARETPVPFHKDLRPKNVDSFVKKFLKRKGVNFNSAVDRRQLNLAGRILDALGPLSQLWHVALQAQKELTGVDPAVVVDMIQRAMSLVGNASHCALVDRRKGLLAKVSPESLDLVDDPELFVPGSSELFGKKFKKAILKDLKLSKEMDCLVSPNRHSNGGKHFKPMGLKPFRQQPGKGPGYNPRVWNHRGWNPSQSRYRGDSLHQKGKSSYFPNQGKQN